MPKFTFERKLSLDGVAIILGVIAALLYIGRMQEKINNLETRGATQSAQLDDVKVSVTGVRTDVAAVKSDVAVLAAVLVERTGKPLK